MKIILVQSEIEEAIRGYINNKGIELKGMALDIDLTAGRKDNGFTATIDIMNDTARVKLVEDSPVEVTDLEEYNTPTVEATNSTSADMDPKTPLFGKDAVAAK